MLKVVNKDEYKYFFFILHWFKRSLRYFSTCHVEVPLKIAFKYFLRNLDKVKNNKVWNSIYILYWLIFMFDR